MSLSVESTKIDRDRQDPKANELIDRTIEEHKIRRLLVTEPEQGYLCITIATGDKLGELYFQTQFEGRAPEEGGKSDPTFDVHQPPHAPREGVPEKGKEPDQDKERYNHCQTGQNRVLLRNMDFLRLIVEELSGEEPWQAIVVAQPCPNADVPVAIERAAMVLAGAIRVEPAVEEQLQADQAVAARHEQHLVVGHTQHQTQQNIQSVEHRRENGT